MRVYFGEVDHGDVEQFGIDGLFEHDGEYYGYCVEYGSNPGGFEDIMLSDACGRRVPVSTEHIDQLITVLQELKNINLEIQGALQLQDFAADPASVATVCEYGHLHY